MPRITLALAVATTLFASTLPVAASAAGDTTQQVDIVGRGTSILRSDEFEAVRGEYLLSDGSRLWIEGSRTRPTVTIDDREPVLLKTTGLNRFITADGRMRLEFHPHRNGSIEGLTLTTGSRIEVARR
jgi:hypothetical protein